MHKIVLDEFKGYYSRLPAEALDVKDFAKREYAQLHFGDQMMIRHLKFGNVGELKKSLVERTPANVYYSSAYYQNPEAEEMNAKGWEGADLIFDIDADHIRTDCKDDHDTWSCLDCGAQGRGFPPDACPKCGKKKIETVTWVCERCLNTAKREIFKLIDEFIIPDFGVSLGEIEICFSGHRGYHLHVVSENVRKLSSDGRREIADYVRGIGLDPKEHGFRQVRNNGPMVGPDMRDGGWRGKIARAMYEFVSGRSQDELKAVVGPGVADTITKGKEKFLQNIAETPPYWGGMRGYSFESLLKIANASVREHVCNIDERVTLDIKRLIRQPNSLHGKSALKTARISYADLERFDPLKDAVAFAGGSIKIYVKEIPRVRIGDFEAGPAKGTEMEVPKALGLYLLCKGAADPRM